MNKFDPSILELIERKHAIKYVETRSVVMCSRCNGTGSYTTEELVDYHKRDYATIRHKCEGCAGDGRLVESKTEVVLDRESPRVTRTPFILFEGDPYESRSETYGIKVDMRDPWLEKTHPELAALRYENYDELVSQIRTLQALKKDFKNGK